MSVRLLFPTLLFEYNLLEEGLITQTYLDELKADMDAMRMKDPVGRQISNAYTGWQSNDGCESRPAWVKMMRIIKEKFNQEILPFSGVDTSKFQVRMGNCWANVNDRGAWNKPHGHNGCWWSGALYINAEGDEGDFVAINTDPKVLSDFPAAPRFRENHCIRPISGTLLCFPSGLLHMVEPNASSNDRYSVAFNMNNERLSGSPQETAIPIDDNWNKFDIEEGEVKR